jgi:hypothetical protein
MAKGKFATFILEKPIEVVDPITGEIRRATRMIVPYGKKDKSFCKVYYRTIQKLTELPKSAQRVFDWLLENMDFENKVYVLNQKELATKLGLAYITVRKALNELKKRGFVKKLNNGLYMVNPQLACKTADNRDLYIQFIDADKLDIEEFIESLRTIEEGEK